MDAKLSKQIQYCHKTVLLIDLQHCPQFSKYKQRYEWHRCLGVNVIANSLNG